MCLIFYSIIRFFKDEPKFLYEVDKGIECITDKVSVNSGKDKRVCSAIFINFVTNVTEILKACVQARTSKALREKCIFFAA
jgi:hypothetical protein